MTYPSDDHRDSVRRPPLQHDHHIINGSMFALAAFAIVAIGIIWYALTDDRARIAASTHQTIERTVPDATTGYGGARPKPSAPSQATKE
ncbi:MAG: hypothetical protein K2Y71_12315 [Xanthobacteraceae bacterium]|nr:hypothetical protein [Xanthobacteraceae bacterium]